MTDPHALDLPATGLDATGLGATGLGATGLDAEAVRRQLDDMARDDLDPHDGRMWGYVYDPGPEVRAVGRAAFSAFADKGALDPTVFPSGARLEREVVGLLARHLGGADAAGVFTTGGTESILLAVKAAREWGRAAGVDAPRIVVAESAHPAFHKAAWYFGLAVDVVPIDPVTFRMEVAATERALQAPGVVLVVVSASTYGQGVVDPVEAIAELARSKGILCHVDGCVGGFMLPFFRELGDAVPSFGFEVPGVTSISVDLHKFALCPRGASVLLHRTRSLRRHHIFAHAAWTGYTLTNMGVQSSRSLGPLAASWAILRHLGADGYRAIARDLRDARDRLVAGIEATPHLEVVGRPTMCVMSFASRTRSVFDLARRLRERRWYVQPQLHHGPSPAAIHLTVNPSNTPHVEAFLEDLRSCTLAASEPPISVGAPLPSRLSGPANQGLDRDTLTAAMATLGSNPIPRGAGATAIHDALDAAPANVREALLIAYTNEILF